MNRAIDASYGEVTGITQTVRNYAASIGLAVFGTMLTHTMTDNVENTLRARGVPADQVDSVAGDVTQSITGQADARTPTGDGPVATTMRDAMSSIRMDFAEANQWRVLRHGRRTRHRLPLRPAPPGRPGGAGR